MKRNLNFESLIFFGMHLRNFFLTILFVWFSYSCKKDVEQPKDLISDKKTEKAAPTQTFGISESLKPSADSIARNWDAYMKVAEFLKINGAISNEETLYNAKDLVKLTESLKDSIPLENLNNPAMKIRINVLHNEALRLQDMADIKVITDKEILEERQKIYDAFSAINYKLNNLTDQAKINDQLKDFIDMEGVDTTRNLLKKDYSKEITE